jgi:hypothetical protein
MINDDMLSMFNPTIKDVMVVAILLPRSIPMLLLKFNNPAFIKLMVKIITAELDWIIKVLIKPNKRLFLVVLVANVIFSFSLFKDKVASVSLKEFIEYTKTIRAPSKIVKVITSPIKIY